MLTSDVAGEIFLLIIFYSDVAGFS